MEGCFIFYECVISPYIEIYKKKVRIEFILKMDFETNSSVRIKRDLEICVRFKTNRTGIPVRIRIRPN